MKLQTVSESIRRTAKVNEATLTDRDGNDIKVKATPLQVNLDGKWTDALATDFDQESGLVEVEFTDPKNNKKATAKVYADDIVVANEAAKDGEGDYVYVVDLDERGEFCSHIEDPDGNVVFSIDSSDAMAELIEDGFMKHKEDVDGLLDHLTSNGVLKKGANLVTEANEPVTTIKDKNKKSPKAGDFIVTDEGDLGKVKSFSKDRDGDRMTVDFRSHTVDLNAKSKFEIVEPDEKVKKAFESKRKR